MTDPRPLVELLREKCREEGMRAYADSVADGMEPEAAADMACGVALLMFEEAARAAPEPSDIGNIAKDAYDRGHANGMLAAQGPCIVCKKVPDGPFSSRNPGLTVCRSCWAATGEASGAMIEAAVDAVLDEWPSYPELMLVRIARLHKVALAAALAAQGGETHGYE